MSQLHRLSEMLDEDKLTIEKKDWKFAKFYLRQLLKIMEKYDPDPSEQEVRAALEKAMNNNEDATMENDENITTTGSESLLITDARTISDAQDDSVFEPIPQETDEESTDDDSSTSESESSTDESDQEMKELPVVKPCQVILERVKIPAEMDENELLVEMDSQLFNRSKAEKSKKSIKSKPKSSKKEPKLKFFEKVRCKICSKHVEKSKMKEHKQAHKLKEARKQFGCNLCDFTATVLGAMMTHYNEKHSYSKVKWEYKIVDVPTKEK